MELTLSLAWRNLWRHKRRTWLTTAAMAVCNMVIIFMISLQGGSYLSMLNNNLALFNGHLQIQHPRYLNDPKPRYAIAEATALATTLRNQNINASSRGISFALLSSETRSKPLQIVGVEHQFEATVSNIPGTLRQGSYLSEHETNGVIISEITARHLKVDIGDELTLLGSGKDDSFAASIVKVIGLYNSGMTDIDRNMVFINLSDFQDIFSFGTASSHIVIAADSIFTVDALKTQVASLLSDDDNLALHDWTAIAPGLKQAIQSDIMSALFIYCVLITVVIFSVLNNQLMAVLERRREYGILLSLGVRHSQLVKLLLMETALLALLGLCIGLLLGTAIAEYTAHIGIAFEGMEEMNAKFNLPARIYPIIHPVTLLIGPILVALGSLCAAFYPAIKLRRLKPLASRYKA